jgi:hypothetical protein
MLNLKISNFILLNYNNIKIKMSVVYVDVTGSGSTKSSIILGSNAKTTDYTNYSLTINSQTQVISAYDVSKFTATLTSDFTEAPAAGVPFIICNNEITVSYTGLVDAGSTVSSVILGKGASTSDADYTNKYITIGDDTVMIKEYKGSTLTATLSRPLSVSPTKGEACAICTADPTAFLFGLNTSFIGGNTYFEIAIVLCIIVLCICCIISLLFVGTGSGMRSRGASSFPQFPQPQPQPMNISLNPIYYPPTYR